MALEMLMTFFGMASIAAAMAFSDADDEPDKPTPPPRRITFYGGCHCGLVRYTATFAPPAVVPGATPSKDVQTARARKCNCSTCHKSGFFHIRLPYAPYDFRILSPLDPHGAFGGLKVENGQDCLRDYTCFEGRIHWLFCSRCAVRCFSVAGEGELVYENSGYVWRLREIQPQGPYREGLHSTGYLTINAHTIDQGQEGCDIAMWQKGGCVSYLNGLGTEHDERFVDPHPWGTV